MQGDAKTCTGAFLCPKTKTPPTQGEAAPKCTEEHLNEPSPSAQRAQNLELDLQKLVELWPSLSEKIRVSILALVEASAEK
jgi:hypothetical protein